MIPILFFITIFVIHVVSLISVSLLDLPHLLESVLIIILIITCSRLHSLYITHSLFLFTVNNLPFP